MAWHRWRRVAGGGISSLDAAVIDDIIAALAFVALVVAAAYLPDVDAAVMPKVQKNAKMPRLDCPRYHNGKWLKGGIKHDGDRMRWSQCWYE